MHKKPDLILHIGVMKTGTTAVQRVLTAQREALLARGVCYPASPSLPDHMLISLAFSRQRANAPPRHPGRLEGMSVGQRIARFLREFEAEMNSLPAHVRKVLIVAESLQTSLRDPQEVQALAGFLKPLFGEIRVVVYLRRQDQFSASNYSQNLRRGVLQAPDLALHGAPGAIDYQALLALWAGAFGKQALSPRIYDRATLVNRDIVADFADAAGIALDMDAAAAVAVTNTSLNEGGQSLLAALGRHLQANWQGEGGWSLSPVWRKLVEHANATASGRGWQPTRAEAIAYMARFAASNEAVRAAYFPQRESLFSNDFSDLPKHREPVAQEATLQAALTVLHSMARATNALEINLAMTQFRARQHEGDVAGMRQALLRVIALDPKPIQARLELAALCLDQGEMAAARAHLEQAEALAGRPNPKLRALRARLDAGQPDRGGRSS